MAAPRHQDDEVLHCVYAVTATLRWILLAHALVVNLLRLDQVQRPVVLVLACAVMLAWTAVAGPAQSGGQNRTAVVVGFDLAVTLVLVAASRWILGPEALVDSYLSVPVYWMVVSPLVVAIWRGRWWGLAAAGLLSAVKLVQEPRVDPRVWDTMVVTGMCAWGLGAIVDALRESGIQREAERTRAAALAERDRLNRIVHDGALQVLAMVEREGPELGPRGQHLAQLARRQEVVLRRQLQDRAVHLRQAASAPQQLAPRQPVQGAASDSVDVASLLDRHADERVTVSVVADAVPIRRDRARELEAAIAEVLSNVAKHAGPDARAWILLETEEDKMIITVRDNGVGMTREQVDRALSGDRMGIQNSILGRIAEIGGEAVARSQPGRGVEWKLRIPLEEV